MATNIHLRGLDEPLVKKLRHVAAERKISMNKVILESLRRDLGLSAKRERTVHHDLDNLAGTWTAQQAKAFLKNISDFEKIDEEIWK